MFVLERGIWKSEEVVLMNYIFTVETVPNHTCIVETVQYDSEKVMVAARMSRRATFNQEGTKRKTARVKKKEEECQKSATQALGERVEKCEFLNSLAFGSCGLCLDG